MPDFMSAARAAELIRSNDRVFIQGGTGTPQELVRAMVSRADELRDVEIIHIHTLGYAGYADPKYRDSFKTNCMFIGDNLRKNVQEGYGSYLPSFLSDMPSFFRSGRLPLDVALVNVSPPDRHGYCSLGVSVDVVRAACDTARTVIAQINPRMPRVFGDAVIHISRFAACVEVDEPVVALDVLPGDDTDSKIGGYIADLIPDGATLQVGIGGIPNAVLAHLHDHKHMGIHTEMLPEGMLPLLESGAIDNSQKRLYPGKTVAALAMGSQKLYDYMDDNPTMLMMDSTFVNDASVICQNPKAVAINSAIEVDLTGQVCADSIGTRMYSGVGGQVDFMRGASLSPGGMAFCAMQSTTGKGHSKIVPTLSPGAGVVTSRAHVQYVVTEYGVADLWGKNLAQRAKALIEIAHPSRREELEKAARERLGHSFVSFNRPVER